MVSLQDNIAANCVAIESELAWLKAVIDTRLKLYFAVATHYSNIDELPVPAVNLGSPYG